MERIVVIGPGRLGLALGAALLQRGEVRRLEYFGRHPEPPAHPIFAHGAEYRYGLQRPAADTTVIFLTVPDAVLPEVVHAMAGQGRADAAIPILHTSIETSIDILAPLHGAGYAVGTFHPLVRVGSRFEDAEALLGAPAFVGGERSAVAAARRIVQGLGGRSVELPAVRRPSAAGISALIARLGGAVRRVGMEGFREAGLDEEEAILATRGLVASVVGSGGSPGPATTDADLELHLRALPEEARDLYRRLLKSEDETPTLTPEGTPR